MQIKRPDISESNSPGTNKDVDEYSHKLRGWVYVENRLLYWIRFVFLIFTTILSLGVVTTYMWHLVGPESCRWLQGGDISKLKDLALTIIVGLIMSFATSYFFSKGKRPG